MIRLAAPTFLALILTAAAAQSAFAEDLQKVLELVQDDKALLLDLREKTEWNRGHLKGSVQIPFSDMTLFKNVQRFIGTLPKSDEKKLYCYGDTGHMAQLAVNIFKRYGVEVTPLRSTYRELVAAGFEKAGTEPPFEPNLP